MNICRKYSEDYDNVTLLNQNNQGQGAARNNGMKFAIGDYIVFVDSDDYVSEWMNERLINKLMINELDVLYYSAGTKDEIGLNRDNNPYLRKIEICNQLMDGKNFFRRSYPDNYIVSPCCATYKKEFLDHFHILFPEGVYYEDNPFFIDVVLHAERIECIQDMLYIRRYRLGSTMYSELNMKKCEDLVAIHNLMWDSIKKNCNLEEDRDFIRKCIVNMGGFWHIIFLYREALYKKNIIFRGDSIENWSDLYQGTDVDWNELSALMVFRRAWIDSGKINEKTGYFFENIKRKYEEKIVDKLGVLPFLKKIKVGIYGIGNHTEALFEWYRKMIGEIRCDYYFIVSKKTTNSFMDKKVVECEEISDDTDAIVVSSMIYQDAMVERLQNNGIEPGNIITLYSKGDRYDIVFAKEVFAT
jgi:glycosyltransferase involved in cell wall biosynthesis